MCFLLLPFSLHHPKPKPNQPTISPHRPNFARAALPPSANPLIASQTPELYPQPNNPPQGWAFGGFLTIEPGPSGRGANTLWWMGVTNCFWWLDREKGVAGLLAGQVSFFSFLFFLKGLGFCMVLMTMFFFHLGAAEFGSEDCSYVVHV